MTTSAQLLGTGIASARALRRQVLDALGAEPNWRFGSDDDRSIVWLAGPLATDLVAEESDPATPGLGVFHAVTTVAEVHDLELARAMVADLNLYTTVNRWSLLGDPGPGGEIAEVEFDDGTTRLVGVAPSGEPGEASEPVMLVVGATFVVGDPAIDLPLRAVVLCIAEQIAKATALATNDFAANFGREWFVSGNGGIRSGDEWNPVVYHYDSSVTPHAEDGVSPMLAAAEEAFRREREVQFQTAPAAWFGSVEGDGFTFEVPYGPGPFPDGVIGVIKPEDRSRVTQTSLVQVFPVTNPHAGSALLVTMRVPVDNDEAPPFWTAHGLNSQPRTRRVSEAGVTRGDALLGFAYGMGAWIEHEGEVKYALCVPAAWQHLLDEGDLTVFFQRVFADLARLSWSARYVLEPLTYLSAQASGPDRVVLGLAAGAEARGAHFGELGTGTDPGASVLGFAWDNLVGRDTQWAAWFSDEVGFRFAMGPANVDFTVKPCACHDDAGVVVLIESVLCRDTDEMRQRLGVLQRSGLPFAVVAEDGNLIGRCPLHTHSDTASMSEGWSVPVAVALAQIAETFGAPQSRGVDLVMPDGSIRQDRDGMLELWNSQDDWIAKNRAWDRPIGLLHAQVRTFDPGFDADWDGETLTVRRIATTAFENEATQYVSYRTSVRFVDHPQYFRTLVITTALECIDSALDPFAVNGLASGRSSTLFGGFHPSDGGLALTTIYPLAFDRSSDYSGEVSYVGTALQHHDSLIRATVQQVDGVTVEEVDAEHVQAGIRNLVTTYQELAQASTDIDWEATLTEGTVAVTWTRPWPYGGMPRLSRQAADASEPTVTGSTIVAIDDDPFGLRLIHTVLALSARPNMDLQPDQGLLAESSLFPSSPEINWALNMAINDGDLLVTDDGSLMIPDIDGVAVARLEVDPAAKHEAWGHVLNVEAWLLDDERSALGETAAPVDLSIGDWTRESKDGGDGATWVYRVCLPPFLLGCLVRPQMMRELRAVVHSVSVHAKAKGGP